MTGARIAPEENTSMSHDKSAVRKILDQAKAAGREALTAPEARGVCEAYGITIPKEGVATSADEAAKPAAGIGFPVVMKIVSPQILHKTEAGGVIVGVKSRKLPRKPIRPSWAMPESTT